MGFFFFFGLFGNSLCSGELKTFLEHTLLFLKYAAAFLRTLSTAPSRFLPCHFCLLFLLSYLSLLCVGG